MQLLLDTHAFLWAISDDHNSTLHPERNQDLH